MATGNIPGDSNAPVVQIPCIVFFVVTPCFVAARFWSRHNSNSSVGWDDWCCLLSWIFCALVSGLMLGSCAYGFGQHIYNLSPENKLMALKLFFVAQIFYKLTMNLTKISILLLYMRIFAVFTWFRWIVRVLISIVTAYMIAAFSASVFQCTPVARAWDKTIPGTCISIEKSWYANAGFSIATDMIILLLPIQPILSLKLPIGEKVAVMGVFVLGAFVTLTSILRMQTLTFSSTSPDTTYDIASSMWTIIEDNTAIICACLPMCKRALAVVFPCLAFERHRNYNNKLSYETGGSRSQGSRIQGSRPRGRWTQFFDGSAKLFEGSASKRPSVLILDPRQVSTLSQAYTGSTPSEEFIMSPVHDRKRAESVGDEESGAIRKVTRYEVAYDDVPMPRFK
ncbi:hypothetical protein KVR01_013099 [Diaporthe batatas]|uniref:uncharacterized protein n=1 Tax=Diaporthe batatas TaxID=748121 RepID=UPI001D0454EE|nr:uncharacterized protein KVR01_013099 [Diaporthe batatas]KAG8157109.1 hypothetical protein KVR01_013099 [Diaporthe batatas]